MIIEDEEKKKKKKLLIIFVFILILLIGTIIIFFKNFSKKTYTISFDSNGGTIVEKQKVKHGKTLKEPTDPTKDDFEFVEWQLNGKTYDFDTKVIENFTLIAVWEIIDTENITEKFTVQFDSDGGSAIANQEIESGKEVELPIPPTKEGYTFIEWQLDGEQYDFTQPVTTNIMLKAVWEKNSEMLQIFTVGFDSNGGSAVNTQNIINGKTAIVPNRPTKNGYIFVEWQLNGKKYDFNQPITTDITLKAVWKVIEKYTVQFDSDGGSNIKNQTIEEGKKITIPATPTKEGYIFVEWQLEGKKYNFNQTISKNITLKAIWKKVDSSTAYGDVDLDGKVTDNDASSLLRYILSEDIYNLTEISKKNADVDLDGKLTEKDAIIIKNYTNKTQGYDKLPYLGEIPIYGDVDLDSKVTSEDAILLLRHVLLSDQYPLTEKAKLNADVDLDGQITDKDAVIIENYVNKKVGYESLPYIKKDILYGDVDLDGKVTSEDATLLLRYTFYPTQYPLAEQGKINADVDLDNKLTSEDAIIIENYVNKKYGYQTLPYRGETPMYGDINLDGKVTSEDATLLLRHVFFPNQYPLSEKAKLHADVDLDNQLTDKDAAIIENYVNKKTGYESLPIANK